MLVPFGDSVDLLAAQWWAMAVRGLIGILVGVAAFFLPMSTTRSPGMASPSQSDIPNGEGSSRLRVNLTSWRSGASAISTTSR